jgi:hypothetical protein
LVAEAGVVTRSGRHRRARSGLVRDPSGWPLPLRGWRRYVGTQPAFMG